MASSTRVPAGESSMGAVQRPVRVLHVLACLNIGGIETWLLEVVRRVNRAKMAIDICTTLDAHGAYDEEFVAFGGVIHRCPLGRNPWSFGRRLEDLLHRHRYDAVHSHLSYFSGFVLRAAARAGVKIRVAHDHTVGDISTGRGLLRPLYRTWMSRWIDEYGTHIVAASKASLASFWGPDWSADPRKHVVYCGISIDKFRSMGDREGVRAELGLPPHARIVLNVGRFIATKRQAFLVDVAKKVCAKRPDTYFVFIGGGPLKEHVEQLVQASGLGERFRFVPAQPGIERFWLAADAFAFPSVSEGFGLVVVEAAAAGLPVIAHDIPSVREIMEVCPSGTLLPVDATAEQWASAVLDSLERQRLSESDRFAMLDRFPFRIEESIRSLEYVYGVQATDSKEVNT